MNLISKKELLALTGISYGQLYRWKREHLIPEEWFIKQSSYTGQETFFPREQILSRIRTILDAKDKYSLEELAGILSPETTDAYLSAEHLCEVEEISPGLLPVIAETCRGVSYEFFEVVLFAAVSALTAQLSLSGEQSAQLLRRAVSAGEALPLRTTGLELAVLKVGEAYHAALYKPAAPPAFDCLIQVEAACSLEELANQIRLKYKARN